MKKFLMIVGLFLLCAPAEAQTIHSFDLTCATREFASPQDPNPVRFIRVRGTGTPGEMRSISVVQIMTNGDSYERLQQYNINTKLYSDARTDTYGWSGTWNKDYNFQMYGVITTDSYTEKQTKNGISRFIKSTPCVRTRDLGE